MKHGPFTHRHPSLVLSLRTRTRLWGTFNIAVALRGDSCGWGSCEKPRRAFVGRLPRRKPDTGLHFIELVTARDHFRDERTWFRWGDPTPTMHTDGSAS